MSVQDVTVAVSSRESEAAAYGHWVKRVVAFVLDELLVVPFGLIGYITISHGGAGWITFGVSILAYGMAMGFYNRCIRMGLTGQSWGKMATSTRLVSERTGEPLGVGNVIVREMCHTLDGILFVGYLLPLVDAKRQTLGDKVTRAVVLDVQHDPVPSTVSLPR